MGPVRGHKKKRKVEKKVEKDSLASGSSENGSADWWEMLSKRVAGNVSPSKGLDEFQSVFKMSRRTFDYICSLAEEHMQAKSAHYVFSSGKPMSLHEQVALAMRRLSSEAIEEKGLHHIRWPSTEEDMTAIKSKFERIQGLPNCCGAIDATHITMMLSSSEQTADVWLDQNKNHSMVLQAVVDPDMRFRDVVTGLPGKLNENSVLQSSTLFELCEKGERLNGNKMKLSEETELREYMVGDSGYALLPWLLTPYQDKELSESKADFNKRHLATRIVAQRALARLKDVWKMIHGMMWRPDKHKLPRFILVCCILHNIVIDMEDDVLDELPLSSHLHDPGYRQEVCESVDKTASVLRDNLSLHLTGR
ncbi:protein ALP1-like isoform X2 [Solanum pennellii]|uniref:Protein ALP1-like isoform X2 n=1 Tax=Solanum pennellii TaxID=28526 RepID=A0ABM1FIE1_SOLPN|nr:protein ALP1-like isoform X2 [Solanum pennellii]